MARLSMLSLDLLARLVSENVDVGRVPTILTRGGYSVAYTRHSLPFWESGTWKAPGRGSLRDPSKNPPC